MMPNQCEYTKPAGGEPDLLGIVRPLVRVLKNLPDYVGKTKQIGEAAQRVLRAMKEAKQPDRLLFVDLPAARLARREILLSTRSTT